MLEPKFYTKRKIYSSISCWVYEFCSLLTTDILSTRRRCARGRRLARQGRGFESERGSTDKAEQSRIERRPELAKATIWSIVSNFSRAGHRAAAGLQTHFALCAAAEERKRPATQAQAHCQDLLIARDERWVDAEFSRILPHSQTCKSDF